jgi:hypothetical protein
VSPVKYELGFYIPKDDVLHSHRRDNLNSYIALSGWALQRKSNVSAVRYELGCYIREDDILHTQKTNSVVLSPRANYTERPPLVDEI